MNALSILVPCSGASRLNNFYATVTNILINTRSTRVYFTINDDKLETFEAFDKTLKELEGLASVTGNEFKGGFYPKEFSKSRMMCHVLQYNPGIVYLMNVDDDVLIPAATLELIQRAVEFQQSRPPHQQASVLMYGLMDAQNKRKHIDYDSNVYGPKDVEKIVLEWGKKVLPHRVWETPRSLYGAALKFPEPDLMELEHDTFLMRNKEDLRRNHGAGSWIINAGHLLFNTKLLGVMQDWDKFMKGEDVILVKNLALVNKMYWICYSTAFHTDWNASELGNPTWNTHLPLDSALLDEVLV